MRPRNTVTVVLAGAIASLLNVTAARAHCQIPCGIYDDTMRVDMILEDVQTIEKSIAQIQALAGKSSPTDVNQLVRWIVNKDAHADKIVEVVTGYFLQQRIKPPQADDSVGAKKYADELIALHGLLVTAMKAKQTVDPAIPGQLKELVERFRQLYFTPEELAHGAQHSH